MDVATLPACVKQESNIQGQFLMMQPVVSGADEPNELEQIDQASSADADDEQLSKLATAGGSGDSSNKLYHCPLCPMVYNVESNLRLHVAIHDADNLVCPECGKKFRRVATLKSHLKLHETEESLLCAECGEELPTQFQLVQHQKERHGMRNGTRNYPCQHCDTAFNRMSALRNHEKVHYRSRTSPLASQKRFRRNIDRSGLSHRCDHCPMKFQNQSRLDSHLRVHTGERPYKCDWCDKTLNHKDTLMRHMDRHLGNRPFQCELCSSGFVRQSHLRLHVKMVHSQHKSDRQPVLPVDYDSPVLVTVVPIVSSSIIKPQISESSSEDTSDAPRDSDDDDDDDANNSDGPNVTATHSDGSLPLTSTDDGVAGEDSADVGSDFEMTNEPLTRVERTGKTAATARKGNVQPRQAVKKPVRGAKPFGGRRKRRRFGTKYTATAAAKQSSIADELQMYTCDKCQESFCKLSLLRVHIRNHTAEGPFVCGVCQSAFSNKTGLDRHLNKHYAQKIHQCAFCELTFSHVKSVENHVRRAHPQVYDEGE